MSGTTDAAAGDATTDNAEQIGVTERAAKEFLHILDEKGLPAETAMRLSVKGGGCAGFAYQIDLDRNPADEFDIQMEFHGVRVLVDMKSEFYMHGSVIDFNDSLMERGFTFKNPTASGTCGCGDSFSI
ncbi:MAG: HesB/IscA family protein [Planctomycetota bacterium]|jgi:iron-sulfur cluster assembly protein